MSTSHFVALCINAALSLSAFLLFVICLFFLIECIAALFETADAADKVNWQDSKVTVLVPAHNEEVVIRSTLEKLTPALKKQDRLVVIADNCNDATAEIARSMGATVIERHDIERKGKGYALDYGLQFIESDPPDVVVIIDADCTVYEDAIAQLTQRAIALMQPIQASYLMIRPKNSHSSKDFVSQFSIIVKNLVRTRGTARLGLPCSLLGTGMAFPWSVIRACDLANDHLVEDLKLGLDLSIAGYNPVFCQEAKVTGYLPQQLQAAKSQRTRWEHGHFQNMQTYVPILLKEAVKQKRFDLLLSILHLCVPPLALLVVIWLALMTVSLLFAIFTTSWIPAAIVATAGFCFLMAIVIAWAKFARQDLPIQELLSIPFYVFWKIPVYLQFLVKPQNGWVRTERDKMS